MAKILSKSGDSLADTYDVEGSIAGIDELLSEEINLTHEMGGVLFAERLVGRVFTLPALGKLQNTAFATGFTVALTPARILGLQVITDVAGRLANAQVSIAGQGTTNNDMPVWFWDVAADAEGPIRIILGGVLATLSILRPITPSLIPNLTICRAEGQPPQSPLSLSLRGVTGGFGAGTVDITALVYVAFAQTGGLSSRGLPLPGW